MYSHLGQPVHSPDMVSRTRLRAYQQVEDSYGLSIPWVLIEFYPADSPTADTEQHKKRRG